MGEMRGRSERLEMREMGKMRRNSRDRRKEVRVETDDKEMRGDMSGERDEKKHDRDGRGGETIDVRYSMRDERNGGDHEWQSRA